MARRPVSLSVRFMAVAAIAVTLVAAVHQGYGLAERLVAGGAEAEHRSYAQAASLARSLAKPVSTGDLEAVGLIVEAAFSDRELRSVTIGRPEGGVSSRFVNSVPWNPGDSGALALLGIRIKAAWMVNLFYGDRFLGTLRAEFLFGNLVLEWRNAAARLLVELAVLLAGISAAVGLLFRHYVAGPLARVVDGLAEFGGGRLERRIAAGGKGELAQLESRVNAMADSIERLYRAVAAQNDNLERLIAERTRQLVASEKQAVVSRLVAGVAHELNTPIGIVLTASTHDLEKTRELSEKLRAGALQRAELSDYLNDSDLCLSLIERNIGRAAELIESFKQVAVENQAGELREFAPVEHIRAVVLTLGKLLAGSSVTVEVAGDESARVRGYPELLTQAVINLCLNAVQHGFSGSYRPDPRLEVEWREAGGRQLLVVRNNGRPIAEAGTGRIFEPFFTTGHGLGCLGLGLAVVRSIVEERLGGTARLARNGDGGWVEFEIDLPLEAPGAEGAQEA